MGFQTLGLAFCHAFLSLSWEWDLRQNWNGIMGSEQIWAGEIGFLLPFSILAKALINIKQSDIFREADFYNLLSNIVDRV